MGWSMEGDPRGGPWKGPSGPWTGGQCFQLSLFCILWLSELNAERTLFLHATN